MTSEPFDIGSSEIAQDPYPRYRRLHRDGGVERGAYNEWLIANADLAEQLLSDDRLVPAEDGANLMSLDGDRHRAVRKLIGQWFTRDAIARMEPGIDRIVEQRAQAVLKQHNTFDVIEDLARPITIEVICEVVGVPSTKRAAFLDAAHAESLPLVHKEMQKLAMELLQTPQEETLVSALADAYDNGKINEDEALENLAFVIFAGYDTTVGLIANACVELRNHPEMLNSLQANNNLVEEFLEETLRHESPVFHAGRKATESIDIGDLHIHKGEFVVFLLGAANRDGARFPNPDDFDIGRRRKHLAFGHGRHFCAGAVLARLEARKVIEALLEHSLEIGSPYPYHEPANGRRPSQLLLTIR